MLLIATTGTLLKADSRSDSVTLWVMTANLKDRLQNDTPLPFLFLLPCMMPPQWDTPPRYESGGAGSRSQYKTVLFCVLRSGTSATAFVAERMPH